MTRIPFVLNLDNIIEVEGYADITIEFDEDGEFKSQTINAIEFLTTHDRYLELTKSSQVKNNVPDNRLWDEIMLRLHTHLDEPDQISNSIELAIEQDEGPPAQPHNPLNPQP
jgi:predicted phosphodiesterase